MGRLEIALMVEGQNGLTWSSWQTLARAVEDYGFVGLYRSDHFTNPMPPDLDSLELWVSLSWLGSHTQRIEFGPLVSPVSFRDPIMTARMAVAVDDLSGGRLQLGLGAGWQAREHVKFGYQLLSLEDRFKRFDEALCVITQLLRGSEPITFSGDYYCLREARLLPRPARVNGPPIIIGGNGVRQTLPLVAKYADEWNALFVTPRAFADLSNHLDALIAAVGRQPAAVRRSLMTEVVFGREDHELAQMLRGRDPEHLRQRGRLVGTAAQIKCQLVEFADAGVQRIMLQWMDHTGLDRLADLSAALLA